MTPRWTQGNRVRLLENGEEFYPRVFQAIDDAKHEILLETFILFEDKVGKELQRRLIDAAQRGVQVDLTVDGYGSPDLSEEFISSLTDAGVRFHVFEPCPKIFGMRTRLFRRLHRKVAVIDRTLAFIGGINFSADHLLDFGPEAKQDYSVELEGPIVGEIRRLALISLATGQKGFLQNILRRIPRAEGQNGQRAGTACVMLVVRDNHGHQRDIERHYREAIRFARREIIIANAYFFPGYQLLRQLHAAARRGVKVKLLLQGEPDIPIVRIGARLLYEYLLSGGVQIYEYCERPFHGKVALVDDDWATVGSSNLDPLSLALNLEANVIVQDIGFADDLRGRLDELLENHCHLVPAHSSERNSRWRAMVSGMVFHVLRHFPSWATWIPAAMPRIARVTPAAVDTLKVRKRPGGRAV